METRNVTIYYKQVVEYHYGGKVNWYPFLWYIAQYATIIDYSEDTVTIHNRSGKAFFRNIEIYSDACATHNYNIDKETALFREHHRGYRYNENILERLWKEKFIS